MPPGLFSFTPRWNNAEAEGKITDSNKLVRELLGLALIFTGIFLFIALFTHYPHDPSPNIATTKGYLIRNGVGVLGAFISGIFVDLFGLAAFCWPVLLIFLGLGRFSDRLELPWWRWTGLTLLAISFMAWADSNLAIAHLSVGEIRGGGFLGGMLMRGSQAFLFPLGALLLWSFIFLTGLQLLSGLTWSDLACRGRDLASRVLVELGQARDRRKLAVRTATTSAEPRKSAADKTPTVRDRQEAKIEPEAVRIAQQTVEMFPPPEQRRRAEPQKRVQSEPGTARAVHVATGGASDLPPLDFLFPVPESVLQLKPETLQAQAKRLEECLTDFGVQGEIQKVVPGPVVTMFEYKPAPGVKINRIANLSNDIALTLKAMAVRIEAPIPGKDAVGLEIPNEHRQTVYLREILESESFQKSKSKLTIALGKDIQGQPRVADLARMPHLLVAGATGAGKSVCLNGILLSFLYKANPDEVKLLLVDPKRIELAAYANLPHLVHPVVTDMALAKSALDWAIYEMDRRYESMARLGVRNIDGFNQKFESFGKSVPEEFAGLAPLPFLVIVIDELADLMMTSTKEVEICIVRLAQLARAAGIHLILATQRPSVDVVTGLIKANFPSRISFQVTSKHDSRTILDTVGAEHLLGRGDMLFKAGGGKLQRLHGAFVSEEEIALIVEYWHAQRPPAFELDFASWKAEGKGDTSGESDGDDVAQDPAYAEALEFVVGQGKASISLIQRRFRIGFNRAARYIEQMERDGLLGPQEGSKPRSVLKGKE